MGRHAARPLCGGPDRPKRFSYSRVVEAHERIGGNGEGVEALAKANLEAELQAAFDAGTSPTSGRSDQSRCLVFPRATCQLLRCVANAIDERGVGAFRQKKTNDVRVPPPRGNV